MNVFLNYSKGLSFGIAVAAAGLFASCADEPDKFKATDGIPVVKYIRCMSTEIHKYNDPADMHHTDGELVTSANPGAMLCLIGENLRSVHDIYFNNLSAAPNPSYITDNTLFISVPAEVPTEVTDKLYLITAAHDTVAVDFHVSISAPVANRMDCEYAKPGAVQRFYGNYFIDDPNKPLTCAFTGENGLVEAAIVNIAEDFRSIDVVVPDGAVSGPVYISSVYGTSETSFHYMDKRGMLFDFDSPNGISDMVLDMHAWNGHNSTTGDDAISGNYWQFGAAGVDANPAADAGWPDETNHSFAYWPGNWESPETFKVYPRLYDLVNVSDWENMTLKFEMLVPSSNPWKGAAMQFVFAGTDKTTNGGGGVDAYGNAIHAQDNAYLNDASVPRALYRPWVEGGSYDTGDQWVTVSLPLAQNFVYTFDGQPCPNKLTKDSFASLWVALYGGGVKGEASQPIIKIDNIRLVPNN